MIIDHNSDSSVDLVDWLRRSADESDGLSQNNRLDSATIADVYKATTGEKKVLDITYNPKSGIMTVHYKDGTTLDIYIGTNNNLDEYVKVTDFEIRITEVESKMPTSTSELTNDSDFVNSTQVDERIKGVVGAAPEALDTLQEISKALGDDADFAATITNQITELKSQIPSVEGLASEKYVNNKVAAVEAKIPSIEGLATESYVGQTKHDIEKWVEEQNYLTEHQDISHLATKDEVKAVEDKIPSLDGYATETYVKDAIEAIPPTDLSEYAKSADVEEAIAKSELTVKTWVEDKNYLTEHQDISDLATKDELKSAIEGIEHPQIDLTPYATKEEIPSLEGYAKEDWVEAKGYLTEHQNISHLASTEYVDNKAKEVESKIPSLDGYATETWVETEIAKIDHSTFALKSELVGLASETYVKEAIEAIPEVDLSGLATKDELADTEAKIPSIEGLATEVYVDEKVAAIEHPTVDLTGYATRDELNSKIAALNSSFQWKDNVVSFEDIAVLYPDPEEGFSVYVDDEQTTYVFMGGEWVATGTSEEDDIPQATEELDGLMPAEAMRKLNSLENYDDSAIRGNVVSIEAQLAILADKVSALSKTNIEVVSPSLSSASFNDPTKDYAIQGEVTTKFVVSSSKSITMTDTKITNDAKLTLKSTGDVELKNVSTEGEFTKTNSNCIVSIPEASSVVIKDMVIQSTQYNGIEIGLTGNVLPKSVVIDNCKFNGEFTNNVISVHGVQDDAVINISNCTFSSVSNPFRLSNRTNAKNITINITNCSCDKWESGKYAGFMLCQDATSSSVEEVAANNVFSKVTINFINFTMPGGAKLTKPEDIATLCGTGNDQLIYVYANALSKADNTYITTPYGDGSAYPTINII